MLNTDQRILEILADNPISKGDYVAPDIVTQGGLSSMIKIDRSQISRSLNRLFKEGLIIYHIMIINGRSKRMRCYSLSAKGYSCIARDGVHG